MDKFRNKYRVQSARLQNWDYGWNAAYFITICTANREYYFGDIVNKKMQLSEIGDLAKFFLLEIPRRYEYAILDEYIIMPNHVHAIIIIDKTDDGRGDGGVDGGNGRGGGDGDDGRDAINRVSTETGTGTGIKTGTGEPPPANNNRQIFKKRGGITGNNNPMLHDNISRILNWYTGRVTFESRKINKNYGWQARFYDHIIRDNAEYQRIKNYIINNPKNWNNDTFNR